MKTFLIFIRFLFTLNLIFLFIACNEDKEKVTEADLIFSSVQTDQIKWWNYHKSNIDLSSEFIPLGIQGDTIEKKAFLETLLKGEYIAIKRKSNSERRLYQLYKMDENADPAIEYTITAETYPDYKHFMMEGKDFPNFTFNDLDGNQYSKNDLLGKTVLIKTWFLRCKPCIDEMPMLNQLVSEYSDREDVVFLSLSTDPEDELKDFLSKREFNYPVVPNSRNFVEDTLGFKIYPTHVVIDKEGKINKVVNTAPEMIAALRSIVEANPTSEDLTSPPSS